MNILTGIQFIEANPRCTAREAGLTNAEANALVGQARIVAVGNRVTGKRGRPPAEYVVAGTVLDNDALAHEQVKAARRRVSDHRLYERLSGAIMRAADESGHGSDEHVEAKLTRTEAFPLELPTLPSKNDYILAGIIAADPTEDGN